MNNEKLPAYPRTAFDCKGDITSDFPEYNGLTKLEAFTMAAMQGLCAMENKSDEVFSSEDEAWAFLAKIAVKIARATLSELQKQQS